MYSYSSRYFPSAPLVEVRLSNPNSNKSIDTFALIDTGADYTAIPAPMAEQLRLLRRGSMEIEGMDAVPQSVPIYSVNVAVDNEYLLKSITIVVTGHEFVVLGRDVLNQFHLVLDGPNERFSIEQ